MHLKFNDTRFDFEDFDNEIVIIDTVTGSYYTVSGTAAVVLRCFFHPASIERVLDAVRKHFPDEVEQAAAFTDWLRKEELIDAAEAAVEKAPWTVDANGSSASATGGWTYSRFDDMSDLIRLDPIHDVSEKGWPHRKT